MSDATILPNWGWHEYGKRVGVWRSLDLTAASCSAKLWN